MSTIENIIYSAYELGEREALLKEVSRIRKTEAGKHMHLTNIYEQAYQLVMKT
tara:strand:+ start:1521 stop:1679 length:159 start_codon:yes stop_codon:yes gene_type:complete